MNDETGRTDTAPYDAIVIGAGMSGVIFLAYARAHGLRCLVLEKQGDVGGLWTSLPAWQDIQNRKEDFALNDVPLEGVTQHDVHEYVREWVRRHALSPFITLECEVTAVGRSGEQWEVETTQGTYRSRYLIVASGVQNEPWIPEVERSQSDVVEVHSSRLHHPEDLADQRVTVAGGGASSWDLLDLAVEHGARDIHWVYRHPHWFVPTRGSKQRLWPNIRELSLMQMILRSPAAVSAFVRRMLKMQYGFFSLREIAPAEPFDIQKHQLIPGRSSMLKHFDVISRHQGVMRRMHGHEITLENGESFETDVVLWGTGYRMNLDYLGLPEFGGMHSFRELAPVLGSLVRSVDYPSLFFVGMSLAESTSSTPFIAAVEAKSIVAHILGRCSIPLEPTPYQVAYWDLLRYFGRFDGASYPRVWWRAKVALLGLWYLVARGRSVKV